MKAIMKIAFNINLTQPRKRMADGRKPQAVCRSQSCENPIETAPCVSPLLGAVSLSFKSPRLAAVVILLSFARPSAAATFSDLGVLPGGTFSAGIAISADGTAVTGRATTITGFRAFRWNAAGGMQDLGVPLGGLQSRGLGISGNGSVVVGYSSDSTSHLAFRLTGAGEMESLGTLPGDSSSFANAVSVDGFIITGESRSSGGISRAFRWTPGGGMQNLGTLAGGDNSSGLGVSGDGAVVAGVCVLGGGVRAIRWTTDMGMQDLGLLPGMAQAIGYAVSSDGSTIVGNCTDLTTTRGFRWTETQGMEDLGIAPGFSGYLPRAVNSNGSIVGGLFSDSSANVRAMLWTPSLGIVDLNVFLSSIDVDITGWTLTEVRGISADGSALTGIGTIAGQTHAWVVTGLFDSNTVCPSIIGDLNGDGLLDGSDVQGFSACVLAGTPPEGICRCGDVDNNGGVDTGDVGPFCNLLLTVP